MVERIDGFGRDFFDVEFDLERGFGVDLKVVIFYQSKRGILREERFLESLANLPEFDQRSYLVHNTICRGFIVDVLMMPQDCPRLKLRMPAITLK